MIEQEINYFIYARKSTEGEDRQSLSIPSQLEDDERIQMRERLNVIETITDSASAKTPDNRSGYSAMIRRIKRGEASGIIAWKIDRLARNHLEWGELMHLLQTGVIKSIWTTQREYKSKDSALLIGLEASMATQYSIDLADMVKRGLQKKVDRGQPPLIARLGYLNTKHNEQGTNEIVVDPVRWPLMRKAFDMMLTGQYTMAQIVAVLNHEHNFRTRPSRKRQGSPLALSILHRAFTDPFYTGYFYYTGKLHKGSYKPMITLEEFDTIQEVLGRKKKLKPKKHEFAFTGFITCGSCGCAVTASKKTKQIKSTGMYKSYVFYHCTKRKGQAVCADKRYTKQHEVEAMVAAELAKVSLPQDWKDWAVETARLQYNDELLKQEALLRATSDYEQKLTLEIDTLLDLRIGNEISDEQYNQKKAERQAQLIRVQEKRRRLESGVNDWLRNFSDLLDRVGSAEEMFKTGDQKLQRYICNLIGWNWTLQGKNLMFTRYDWFYSIERLKIIYGQENSRLEPIKTFDEYRETASFQASIPEVCGIRDTIGTFPPKDPEMQSFPCVQGTPTGPD